MKAVVFNLGCKVNECESNSILAGLKERGYDVTDKLEVADLYVVNTCAVTREAEKKSRQMFARISKLNPSAKIIFAGCACQNDPKAFSCKNSNCLITGVYSRNNVFNLLNDVGEHIAEPKSCYEELPISTSLKTRTFIKVQDGCDNFCTYCIIPYLRGRSRSRDPENVIKEIEMTKPQEAVITGINLSAYNYNGQGLVELISHLKQVDCRIRLGSLEVNVITENLLEELQGLKDFAQHFHLSLQSGSDAVLKKMNRHYTAEEYLSKCSLIRNFFPTAGITTDIIAGFPTETEENFKETIDIIDKVKFSDIHCFMFSARKGTVAYKMEDLPFSVKKNRLDRLLEKKMECKKAFVEFMKNKVESVLFEFSKNGYSEGYSGNYIRIYVKGELQSGIKRVRILDTYKDGAIAELI